jgi:hypothetical protein
MKYSVNYTRQMYVTFQYKMFYIPVIFLKSLWLNFIKL